MAKNQPQLPAEVLDALRSGNTIEAIKRLRKAQGLGLAEAKHVIESVRSLGKAPAAPSSAPIAMGHVNMPAAAVDALQRGHKIEAIRLYREHAGVGLKEAKDVVEAYEGAHPRLDPMVAPGEVPRGRGRAGWVIVAILLGLAIVWAMRR